jgi:glycine dehydrogenase subunit 2
MRPAEAGVDVMHFNLHKTFSTPHGGGGPGCGPCGVKSHLAEFLPGPRAERVEDGNGSTRYTLIHPPQSFGRVRSFVGNYGMFVRAYTYIRIHGADGLRAIGDNAVLNANYLQARLKETYGRREYGPDRHTMHETVLSGWRQKAKGVRTLDIAKRLIDYGYHPPTIYFPLIVEECLMLEPTETESKQSIDGLANAFLAIAAEVESQPDVVRNAPHYAPVMRLDETTAARRPNLRWRPK